MSLALWFTVGGCVEPPTSLPPGGADMDTPSPQDMSTGDGVGERDMADMPDAVDMPEPVDLPDALDMREDMPGDMTQAPSAFVKFRANISDTEVALLPDEDQVHTLAVGEPLQGEVIVCRPEDPECESAQVCPPDAVSVSHDDELPKLALEHLDGMDLHQLVALSPLEEGAALTVSCDTYPEARPARIEVNTTTPTLAGELPALWLSAEYDGDLDVDSNGHVTRWRPLLFDPDSFKTTNPNAPLTQDVFLEFANPNGGGESSSLERLQSRVMGGRHVVRFDGGTALRFAREEGGEAFTDVFFREPAVLIIAVVHVGAGVTGYDLEGLEKTELLACQDGCDIELRYEGQSGPAERFVLSHEGNRDDVGEGYYHAFDGVLINTPHSLAILSRPGEVAEASQGGRPLTMGEDEATSLTMTTWDLDALGGRPDAVDSMDQNMFVGDIAELIIFPASSRVSGGELQKSALQIIHALSLKYDLPN